MVAFYITKQAVHRPQWADFKTFSIINNLTGQINSTNKVFYEYSIIMFKEKEIKFILVACAYNNRKRTSVN